MSEFSLHPRLAADCHHVCKLSLSHLLLLNNAHHKWFILVPEVSAEQLHLLQPDERNTLLAEVQTVSEILENEFSPKRINVGAIGNMVPQLHFHVVARFEDDPAWPGVVWGHPESIAYQQEELDALLDLFKSKLNSLTSVDSLDTMPSISTLPSVVMSLSTVQLWETLDTMLSLDNFPML